MNQEIYNELNQTTRGAIEIIKMSYRNGPDIYGNMDSVCLFGVPGLGKTSIVRQAAKELGLQCLVISPASHDILDLKLPYLDTKFKFFGRKKTEYKVAASAIGDILPRNGRYIILLDDIGNAPLDMQASIYSLMLEGTLSSYKIPEGSMMVAASNRTFDKCNVTELSAALKDRLIVINVNPDKRIWLDDFAYPNNLNHVVTSWIEGISASDTEDRFLNGFEATDPCGGLTPRSAYRLSKILKNDIHTDIDKRALFKGIIGQKAGHDFFSYYNNHEVFDNVRKILNGEDYDKNMEHGTKFMVASALSAAVDIKSIKNVESFCKESLDDEKKSFMVHKIHLRNKVCFNNRYFKNLYIENYNHIS